MTSTNFSKLLFRYSWNSLYPTQSQSYPINHHFRDLGGNYPALVSRVSIISCWLTIIKNKVTMMNSKKYCPFFKASISSYFFICPPVRWSRVPKSSFGVSRVGLILQLLVFLPMNKMKLTLPVLEKNCVIGSRKYSLNAFKRERGVGIPRKVEVCSMEVYCKFYLSVFP